MSESKTVPKPFLRGHFHQAAFFLSLGACSVLIAMAQGSRVRLAATIYGVCLAGLYGVSSLYHRPHWGPRARIWMKRLDHAAIFLLIAGTATPVAMIGMQVDDGYRFLAFFWIAAGLGVLKEVFWVHSPKWISAVLYTAVGWLGAPYLPAMYVSLGTEKIALILTGGAIYSAGAIIYALKKPNPYPRVFGYHEIFHALVIVASVFHFIVIYQLVRAS